MKVIIEFEANDPREVALILGDLTRHIMFDQGIFNFYYVQGPGIAEWKGSNEKLMNWGHPIVAINWSSPPESGAGVRANPVGPLTTEPLRERLPTELVKCLKCHKTFEISLDEFSSDKAGLWICPTCLPQASPSPVRS